MSKPDIILWDWDNTLADTFGAILAAQSGATVGEIEGLCEKIEITELSFSEVFRDKYMENMYF